MDFDGPYGAIQLRVASHDIPPKMWSGNHEAVKKLFSLLPQSEELLVIEGILRSGKVRTADSAPQPEI